MSSLVYKNEIPKGILCYLQEEERRRYLIWHYFFVPMTQSGSAFWERLFRYLFDEQMGLHSVDVLQMQYVLDASLGRTRVVSDELQADLLLRVNEKDIYRVCYPICSNEENCIHVFKMSTMLMENDNKQRQGLLEHRMLNLDNKRRDKGSNIIYLQDNTLEMLHANQLNELMPLLMVSIYFSLSEEKRCDRDFWIDYIEKGLKILNDGRYAWVDSYFVKKIVSIWNEVCKEIFINNFELLREIQNIFKPYLQYEREELERKIREELTMKFAVLETQKREDIIRKTILFEYEVGTSKELCVDKLQAVFGLEVDDIEDRMEKMKI